MVPRVKACRAPTRTGEKTLKVAPNSICLGASAGTPSCDHIRPTFGLGWEGAELWIPCLTRASKISQLAHELGYDRSNGYGGRDSQELGRTADETDRLGKSYECSTHR